MKRMAILAVIILSLSIFTFGGVYIGGGIMKLLGNSSDMQGIYFEGRITVGKGLSLDLVGVLPQQSEEDEYSVVNLLTYLNVDVPISKMEIYGGFSPLWSFYNGVFLEEYFKKYWYIHGGVALTLKPVRLYAEIATIISYQTLSFEGVPGVSVGAQIGF